MNQLNQPQVKQFFNSLLDSAWNWNLNHLYQMFVILICYAWIQSWERLKDVMIKVNELLQIYFKHSIIIVRQSMNFYCKRILKCWRVADLISLWLSVNLLSSKKIRALSNGFFLRLHLSSYSKVNLLAQYSHYEVLVFWEN